jgi:hypothetical protein
MLDFIFFKGMWEISQLGKSSRGTQRIMKTMVVDLLASVICNNLPNITHQIFYVSAISSSFCSFPAANLY